MLINLLWKSNSPIYFEYKLESWNCVATLETNGCLKKKRTEKETDSWWKPAGSKGDSLEVPFIRWPIEGFGYMLLKPDSMW